MTTLQNKVLIITGASSGIGEAAARLFAKKGAQVVLAARRKEKLEKIANEIGKNALVIAADMTREEDRKNIVEITLKQFGRIDVLINNAGFGHLNWLDAMDPEKDIASQIDLNLTSVIQMSRLVLPAMIKQRSGHIINMSSIAGFIGSPTYSVYASTKFALRGFSESLRREVAASGIAVSVVCPGSVTTEFGKHTGNTNKNAPHFPRWLTLSSEDIAKVLVELVENPTRLVVVPLLLWLGIFVNFWLPSLVDWFIARRYKHP